MARYLLGIYQPDTDERTPHAGEPATRLPPSRRERTRADLP